MADLIDHLNQARHNEQCAYFIIKSQPNFRDWAITSAFYAAVHFAEACFTTRAEIGHTEKVHGTTEPHQFRSDQIKRLAPKAFENYKILRQGCWNVRYLTKGPWQKYYGIQDAETLIKSLAPIRAELENAFKVKLS